MRWVGATHPSIPESRLGKTPFPQLTIEGIDGSPLPRGPQSKSLGAVMAQFKSRVIKRLWKFAALKSIPIWQRNYYEHIIRDQHDLPNKTDYIEANPMLWDEGAENPKN